MIAVIRGTGSYIPPRVVENEELKNYIETNDTWIRERTGIERRHVVTDDTVASMAVAGKAALENAGIQAESLELIIVSTTSPTQMIPCNACLVQKELGAVKAACFDLNAACSGFITAYQTACAYIESGFYQKILVIGSEALYYRLVGPQYLYFIRRRSRCGGADGGSRRKTGICLWCRWQDGRCIDTIQRVFFKSVWHAGADAESSSG